MSNGHMLNISMNNHHKKSNNDFFKKQTILDTDVAVVSFCNNFPSPLPLFNAEEKKDVCSTHSTRFNPFNKTQDESEKSFSTDASERDSSCSGSLDTSFAELGITENYFTHPDGNLGLSSIEELEMAIENCKSLIMKSYENSNKRKKLVKNLVELRYRLQKLKDDPVVIEPRTKLIKGHNLRKCSSRSMKNYCDCCTNLIWGMIQVWYKCSECGFCCHSKCVSNLRRQCTTGIATLQLDICPEIGLSQQQYSCAECRNPISMMTGVDEARLCIYNGLYYCSNCHWNDLIVIPGKIVHNWDLSQHPVCRQSYQALTNLYNKPTLNINKINPMLFNFVEELAEIRKMREDIIKMKEYFLTCSVALNLKLLLLLKKRQYFVDNSEMYSVRDLVETSTGVLTVELAVIHTTYAKHIKLDCLFCQAKGFICEICNSGETLYPFDSAVISTCPKCSAVFHRDCFICIDVFCPRCKRKNHKREISSFSEDFSSTDKDVLHMIHYPQTNREIDLYTTVKANNDVVKLSRGRSNAISQNLPHDSKSLFSKWVDSKKVVSKGCNQHSHMSAQTSKPHVSHKSLSSTNISPLPKNNLDMLGTRYDQQQLEEGTAFPLLRNLSDLNISLPNDELSKKNNLTESNSSLISYDFQKTSGNLKQISPDPSINQLGNCDDSLNPFSDNFADNDLKKFMKTENNDSKNPFYSDLVLNFNDETNPFSEDYVDSTNLFQ